MPRALAVDVRQQIVERRLAGATLDAIARDLGVSPDTVRTIWRRYQARGEAGLVPDYVACGRPGPRYPAPLYERALALRRAHPGWGAGLVRVELADAFPGQRLPHEATLRRWFRTAGLRPPAPPPPPPDPPRATVPHQRWQLDATERIALADGTLVSWLAASDEASGAMLGAVVFPLRELDPGRSARGAGGAAGLVRPLGAAGRAAARQRRALGGGRARLPARSGLVARGVGDRLGLEQAPAQAGQRRRRARSRGVPALGGGGHLPQPGGVAGALGLGHDRATGALPGLRRAEPAGPLPGPGRRGTPLRSGARGAALAGAAGLGLVGAAGLAAAGRQERLRLAGQPGGGGGQGVGRAGGHRAPGRGGRRPRLVHPRRPGPTRPPAAGPGAGAGAHPGPRRLAPPPGPSAAGQSSCACVGLTLCAVTHAVPKAPPVARLWYPLDNLADSLGAEHVIPNLAAIFEFAARRKEIFAATEAAGATRKVATQGATTLALPAWIATLAKPLAALPLLLPILRGLGAAGMNHPQQRGGQPACGQSDAAARPSVEARPVH